MPNVGNARDHLVRLHAELFQLESHIRTVRESVQSAIAQSSHHAALVPNENALIARIVESGGLPAGGVIPRLTCRAMPRTACGPPRRARRN
jgi:hypothetical protein